MLFAPSSSHFVYLKARVILAFVLTELEASCSSCRRWRGFSGLLGVKVFGADTEPLSCLSPVWFIISPKNPFLRLLSTLSARALCARLAGKRSTGLIGFGSNLSPRLSLLDHTDNCRCPLFPHCCPQDRNVFVLAGSSCSSFLPFTLKRAVQNNLATRPWLLEVSLKF